MGDGKDVGVDQFNTVLMHDAQEETLERYGQEIILALAKQVRRVESGCFKQHH